MTIVAGSNAFGFELWARVRALPGNLAISPASISTALAMTYAGARGETAKEMQRVLHLPDGAMQQWDALWRSRGPGRSELRIANRLFGERSLGFEQAVLDETAALEPLDFIKHPAQARATINAWVERETRERIRELLPVDAITVDTRLVLVNALYFLAKWVTPFVDYKTRPAKFLDRDVPTMNNIARFGYAKRDGVQLLAMPYRGGESMLVMLPDARDGALDVDADRLAGWRSALETKLVQVALPKFRIDATSPLSLEAPLKALGMTTAFSRDAADFSGMTTAEALCLSSVFHKTFVRVDEKGTEAAAATAAAMVPRSGPPRPEVTFIADRPFLFAIIDDATGLVLFLGRCTSPA
ncbi:MAG TPA: serpin family protein [Kofleriaceae bacterium]